MYMTATLGFLRTLDSVEEVVVFVFAIASHVQSVWEAPFGGYSPIFFMGLVVLVGHAGFRSGRSVAACFYVF